MPTRIQSRRATAAQWAATNPILAPAEMGVETDTGLGKMGDGTTVWSNLPYHGLRSPATLSAGVNGPVTINGGHIPSTRTWVLNGNVTVSLGSAPASNMAGTVALVVKQAASGGPWTVTWPTIVWAEGASAPSVPTTPNAELIVQLVWTGQAWRGAVVGSFFP